MRFTHYDLRNRQGGEIIEVTLSGNAANVRLLDNSNFQGFRAGRQHRYYGGQAKKSPVRLQVPHSGHWHVVIDLGGYGGTVRSSIRVLSGPLKPLQEVPLSSVPSLVQREDVPESEKPTEAPHDFDVFISYASEDRDAVVQPLAIALKNEDLRVWYDEFELSIGDSLRRKIDAGLAKSRFGVVVLSKDFFNKDWPNYELDGLVTRAVTGEQVLLPVWHKVSKQEVMGYSPPLADKLARNTATHTVEEIAREIADVIRNAGLDS